MNLHLVTGYAGKEHVTSADQGAFHAALLLNGSVVLNWGKKFEASIVSNNLIKILDGAIMMQGRFIMLDSGTFSEVEIENGTQDYKRNDLIVVRYTKNENTGVENTAFVVIKGTPNVTQAVDPEYIQGSILDGELVCDMPLYRVPIDGLNVGELVPLFETIDSFDARIAAIINGTTQAGDSKKLGGARASDYLLLKNFIAGALGTKAKYYPPSENKNCNDIDEFLVLAEGATDDLNYPTTGAFYYIFTLKYSDTNKKQIAFGYKNNAILTRYCNSGTWTDWDNAKDGGNANSANALAGSFVSGSIKTYAHNVPMYKKVYVLTDENTTDLPVSGRGIAEIEKRVYDVSITYFCFENSTTYTTSYDATGGFWYGWSQFATTADLANYVDSRPRYTARISDSFTIQDLLNKDSVTFFTNWVDSTNFPFIYGSGVVIPTLDVNYVLIIYGRSTGEGDLSVGSAIRDNGSWTITWDTKASKADLAKYLPIDGSKPATGFEFPICDGNVVIAGDRGYALLATIPVASDRSKGDSLILRNPTTGLRGIVYKQIDENGEREYPLLHSGNFYNYALATWGGSVGNGATMEPLIVIGTDAASFVNFNVAGIDKGAIGFDVTGGPVVRYYDHTYHTIHTDRNSARVVVSETPLTAEGSVRVW